MRKIFLDFFRKAQLFETNSKCVCVRHHVTRHISYARAPVRLLGDINLETEWNSKTLGKHRLCVVPWLKRV